jgi:hypothetical protein
MPTLTVVDGTESVVVTHEQMATCRLVLDMDPAAHEAFLRLLHMGPDRWRALTDLADSQLQLEGVLASPPPEPRPRPKPVDGELVYPIACTGRVRAAQRGESLPACTWTRDVCGFACTVKGCGVWVEDDTARGAALAECFATETDG